MIDGVVNSVELRDAKVVLTVEVNPGGPSFDSVDEFMAWKRELDIVCNPGARLQIVAALHQPPVTVPE